MFSLYKHITNTVNGYTILIVLLFSSITIFSQQEKKFIIEGNKNYGNKKYVEAEKSYKQGLTKNKDSYKSAFNLGDAYYQQGKYEEAAEQFQILTHKATSKDTLSKAYHNLGNSLLQSKKYEEGINAYKNALKNNPNDEDSRYNLAYAQKMLQQQQQQQNKDNKDKKDDKDNKDNKDNKNKDNKEDDKKDKDKKNENKDNKNDKNKEQEKQQGQISKEDAQRLLDALQNDEKNLQDKMKKEKAKGIKVDIEKDW
jgi:Ca-activated chloride channel family protein